MIRVIGLNGEVYERVLEDKRIIVKNCDDTTNMIEFIPQCALDFQNGMITIECGENSITFLSCDYWRIEIE